MGVILGVPTRAIPGHPGYFAGDDGHIYSLKRASAPRRLAEGCDRYGYPTVQVAHPLHSGETITRNIHRMVCAAYHGAPEPTAEVLHFDGVASNNQPSNLRWGSAKENAADRERHGRTARGEKNLGANKLTEEQAREIKCMLTKRIPQRAIARRFGVSQTTVTFINTGRLWRHVQ